MSDFVLVLLQRILVLWFFQTMTLLHFTLQLCYQCPPTLHHMHHLYHMQHLHHMHHLYHMHHLHHLHHLQQLLTLQRQSAFHNTVSPMSSISDRCSNSIKTSNIRQKRGVLLKVTIFTFSSAVPPDWFSSPDSLKESFRIASNLDWANIDLSSHPGLCLFNRVLFLGLFHPKLQNNIT